MSLASGNATKAGLPASLDEINAVIAEASRDSRFTAAETRRKARLQERIMGMRGQLETALARPRVMARAARMVDELTASFAERQDAVFAQGDAVCWVCVDLDAFFAAVETLDHPEYAETPLAVGGMSMLSTSNYAARRFGVSAAMPGYIALKLCPQLRIVPPNFARYREMSARVAAVLARHDPGVEMRGLDEAVMCLVRHSSTNDKETVNAVNAVNAANAVNAVNTANEKDTTVFMAMDKLKTTAHMTMDEHNRAPSTKYASFAEHVAAIRKEVTEATGLTCSAGLAANFMLAKLASNVRKPNGQFEISRHSVEEMREYLWTQPVRRVSGIGRVMTATLEGVFEVQTVGDLWRRRHLLPLVFGRKTWTFLVACAMGHGDSDAAHWNDPATETASHQKSMSCERTFSPASRDLSVLERKLDDALVRLQRDAAEADMRACHGVGIKIKSADFQVSTRERAIAVFDWSHVRTACYDLLHEFLAADPDVHVRLFGVRLSKIVYHERPVDGGANVAVVASDGTGSAGSAGSGSVLDSWLASEAIRCPICNHVILGGEVSPDHDAIINAHIDTCLTKQTLHLERQAQTRDMETMTKVDEKAVGVVGTRAIPTKREKTARFAVIDQFFAKR